MARTRARAVGALEAIRDSLPRGGTLPPEDWRHRHNAMVVSVWLCVLVLLPYGAAERYPLWHTLAHVMSVVPLGVIAGMPRFTPKIRSAAASLALLTVCALLVHISGGLIEMHFSFFVVIVVLTLYEDWMPFLLAVAYVLIHHGVVGTLEPHQVFNRPDAWANPWKWAGIHALFVALAGVAGVVAWRLNENVRVRMNEAQRKLEVMSETDALTGLPNRRKLVADLDAAFAEQRQTLLMLFDLNGFKNYNDTFGHVVGDSLLTRLGQQLLEAVSGTGMAYRLGGDEFCVVAPVPEGSRVAFELLAAAALSEIGDGFTVTSSYGSVLLPQEAPNTSEALRLADERMYIDKDGSRPSAGSQSRNVLVQVLAERLPDLEEHLTGVAELAAEVGERLGLTDERRQQLFHAAQLHDVGKIAIPDAIISKPAALDESEWAFMRQHTVIGQRIIEAAPALDGVGELVRSSHERWDGGGYPDGLEGQEIPLGARIVAVCDAFDAMISERPYKAALPVEDALAELARCAGAQFDPAVVEAFALVVTEREATVQSATK
jgi:diguanylate cyclase (GGDEF)-like protein